MSDARSDEMYQKFLANLAEITGKARAAADSAREILALHGYVDTLLQYAVWSRADAGSGAALLRQWNAPELLGRIVEIEAAHLAQVRQSASAPVLVLDLLMSSEGHIAMLLDELECARQMVGMSEDAVQAGRARRDRFWSAYVNGLECLLQRRPFEPPLLKLSGFQRTLEPCLRLMAALSTRADTTNVLRELDEAFTKRQTDRRITAWGGRDGDGRMPVRWDFRRAAILRAAGAA